MLFNSIQFWIFFLLVLALVRTIAPRQRLGVLLAASLAFYGLWIPAYLALLLFTITLNYALLRAMAASSSPRPYLIVAIVSTLGLLGFFKYAAFAIETIAPVLRWSSGVAPDVPDVVLPLGISFYSFQIISVAIDTYRGSLAPIHSFARYALFVCFFPQLIAGPIVRGDELLPQLARGPELDAQRDRRGVWLIACGLAKKVVLADFLLAPFVDSVFDDGAGVASPVLLIATYSFAFQIYFDFSGYSDIARGLGLLLGFELPFNFKEPYLSRDPSEFWRRWHITLSSWLRDYLYIPLGGNRQTRGRTAINLMLTMLLGGLWHGASWTFVVWGGLHGILLVACRPLSGRRGTEPESFTAIDWIRVLLMFHAACLLWIFFRAETFASASAMISAMARGDYRSGWPVFQTLVVTSCCLAHPLERYARRRCSQWQGWIAQSPWGPVLEGAAVGGLAATCTAVASGGEFIYFQF